MAETAKYNGWTNYETWAVKLWIDNDQASYSYWREQAVAAWDAAKGDDTFTRQEAARIALCDMLNEEFESGKDQLLEDAKQSASVWADLLGAALSEVNWGEIADALIDDIG